MMGLKRKHSSPAQHSKSKRAKGTVPAPSPHPHGDVDPEKFYKARNILDEDAKRYLIDWEDDEITGEAYEPTWEPKEFANRGLVADWKRRKAVTIAPVEQSKSTPELPQTPAAATKRPRGRPRRVLLSSPETSSEIWTANPPPVVSQAAQPNAGNIETPQEIIESQELELQPEEAESPLFVPLIEPSPPPSSYQAGAYQEFSQSQADPPSSSALPATSLSVHSLLTELRGPAEGSSRVIPDSQSLIEKSNSAPATVTVPSFPEQQDSNIRGISEEPSALERSLGSASVHASIPDQAVSAGPAVVQDSDSLPPSSKELSSLMITDPKTPHESLSQHPGRSSPDTRQFQTQIPLSTNSTKSPRQRAEVFSDILPSVEHNAIEYSPSIVNLQRISSPIASIPSYSIRTIGQSAPPPPGSFPTALNLSPSHLEMSSQDSNASLAARLKAIRAQRLRGSDPNAGILTNGVAPQAPPPAITSVLSQDRERRSPSAVPAVTPNPPITKDEMNTSERYETLLPELSDCSIPVAQRASSFSSSKAVRPVPPAQDKQPHTHVVPIALLGHQRDQYAETIVYERDMLERFLASVEPDAGLFEQVERFVERIRNVTIHPDLANTETLTQYEVEPWQQAQWSVDCSGKFRFLKAFLESIRDHNLHILIPVQSARLSELIRTFLTGINVRQNHSSETLSSGLTVEERSLTVTLVEPGDEMNNSLSAADLLIHLDNARSSSSWHEKGVSDSIPSITLVVPCSLEHVELCISPAITSKARLRTLIAGMLQYRHEAGKLDDEQETPEPAGKKLGSWLATASQKRGEFPLATLAPLNDLDGQTESEMEVIDDSKSSLGTSHKRVLEDGIEETAAKKPRIPSEPVDMGSINHFDTINPQDLDMTRISDSVSKPAIFNSAASHEAPTSPSTGESDTVQRLQHLLYQAQQRLEEHVQALNELQYRHEEQREELVKLRANHNSAVETARTAVAKFSEVSDKLSSLKSQRTELQERLDEANARLLDHTIPERRELETLRLTLQQSREQSESLEKRLAATTNDLEYLRGMYQTSSQSAQTFATQIADLEKALASSQKRASDETAKLRQMGYDNQTTLLRNENRRLRALVRDRDAAIKFRDEEIARLKEASRGRIGTRATSVPRSPRLGSPMKVPRGVGGGGAGSRQGSPAAGEVRGLLHPLRNG